MPGNLVQNPSKNDVYLDIALTNMAQKWMQDDMSFVATRAFPTLSVNKQSSQYYVFNRGDFFRRRETARAPGTAPRQIGFNLSRESYNAEVWGLRTLITDEDRSNQDAVVQLDQSSIDLVMQGLMIDREIDFANKFMSGNVWYNGGSSASAGQDVDWSGATSDPISNVDAAKDGVHKINGGGMRPNKAVMGRTAYTTLKNNDAVLDRISGGATTVNPALVTQERIAQILELDAIYVMDAIENDAVEGADDNFEFIGTDNMLLYYAPDAISTRTPTAAAKFNWTGLTGATEGGIRALSYRHPDPGVKADYVEAEMTHDMKVTGASLGHLFTSVSS